MGKHELDPFSNVSDSTKNQLIQGVLAHSRKLASNSGFIKRNNHKIHLIY